MGLFHRKNKVKNEGEAVSEQISQQTQKQSMVQGDRQQTEQQNVTGSEQQTEQQPEPQSTQQAEIQSQDSDSIDFTYEHKDKLGRHFLMNTAMPKDEELASCTTQELAFLMKTAITFHNGMGEDIVEQDSDENEADTQSESSQKDDFIKKYQIFRKVYVDKITHADKLYVMMHPETGYPFLDGKDSIWMFTSEKLARLAKEHYEETGMHFTIKEVEKDQIKQYFADLYTWGMENIIVDMGGYLAPLHRAEILPAPDFSKTPKINRPVMNPELTRAMLSYLQVAYTRKEGEQMSEVEMALLNQVIGDIAQARFLCPVQYDKDQNLNPDKDGKVMLKKDMTIRFAFATNKSGETALPIFTDWNMFHKMYKDSDWSGQIMTYQDALAIAKDQVIVINPMGIEFHITKSLREPLEKACEYFKEHVEEK